MKPTQQQIQALLDRGIAPGAMVISAQSLYAPTPQLVRPTEEWYILAGEVNNGGGFYLTYNGSFAKVITPAPQAEGLIDGMACVPDGFIRGVIIAKAKEVGLAEDHCRYSSTRLAYFTDCSVLQDADGATHKPTALIPPGEFYDRLCRMTPKPKPIVIHSEGRDYAAELRSNGSIKVGCTVIDSETMEGIIEGRAKAMGK